MPMYRTPIFLTLAISFAGCAQEPASEPAAGSEAAQSTEAARAEAGGLIVTVEGVRTGSADGGDAIVFGLSRDVAEAFVIAQRGEPTERGDNDECGAGPMAFSHFAEFTLNFQDDVLVGWSLAGIDGPAVTTPAGLTVGSTRAEVDAAPQAVFEETSLGTEFTADGVDGMMSDDTPDGAVTNLWAGTNCIFR